jgi:DNA-binding CsgD family transcriptional regulator
MAWPHTSQRASRKDRVGLLAKLYGQSRNNPRTSQFLEEEIAALEKDIAEIQRLIRFRDGITAASSLVVDCNRREAGMAPRHQPGGKVKKSHERLSANLRDLRSALAELRAHHQASRELQLAAQRVVATLSKRQLDVLRRVARGQPSKAIAFDLGITEKTVETHRP